MQAFSGLVSKKAASTAAFQFYQTKRPTNAADNSETKIPESIK